MGIKIQLHDCPVCHADLTEHQAENEAHFEWWHFDCGAEIVNGPGGLEENEPCRFGLPDALAQINAAAKTKATVKP